MQWKETKNKKGHLHHARTHTHTHIIYEYIYIYLQLDIVYTCVHTHIHVHIQKGKNELKLFVFWLQTYQNFFQRRSMSREIKLKKKKNKKKVLWERKSGEKTGKRISGRNCAAVVGRWKLRQLLEQTESLRIHKIEFCKFGCWVSIYATVKYKRNVFLSLSYLCFA